MCLANPVDHLLRVGTQHVALCALLLLLILFLLVPVVPHRCSEQRRGADRISTCDRNFLASALDKLNVKAFINSNRALHTVAH